MANLGACKHLLLLHGGLALPSLACRQPLQGIFRHSGTRKAARHLLAHTPAAVTRRGTRHSQRAAMSQELVPSQEDPALPSIPSGPNTRGRAQTRKTQVRASACPKREMRRRLMGWGQPGCCGMARAAPGAPPAVAGGAHHPGAGHPRGRPPRDPSSQVGAVQAGGCTS